MAKLYTGVQIGMVAVLNRIKTSKCRISGPSSRPRRLQGFQDTLVPLMSKDTVP